MKTKTWKEGFRFSFVLLFCAMLIFTAYYCITQTNPDTDAFFLIKNGEWIWENKSVPTTNPWSNVEGLGIILQQPLCSLLNYFGYKAFGLERLWVLALMENAVLFFAAWYASGVFVRRMPAPGSNFFLDSESNIKNKRLFAVTIFLFIIGLLNYVSTRPYQITIATSLFCLGFLVKYIKRGKFSIKAFLLLSLTVLFQANYQMSFVIIPFLWLLCFAVPGVTELKTVIKTEKPEDKYRFPLKEIAGELLKTIKTVLFYLPAFLFSLLNPYGVSGVLYLYKSKHAMELLSGSISETVSPSILSCTAFLIVANVLLLIYLTKKHTLAGFYYPLVAGCALLSALAYRNIWTVVVCLFFLLCEASSLKRLSAWGWRFYYNIPTGMLLAAWTCILLSGWESGSPLNLKMHDEADAILTGKEDVTLYTTFNTGALMEFYGYKTFLDARPELYDTEIAGENAILQEWYNVEYAKVADVPAFIEKYGFNYFEVTSGSVMDIYLKYADGYTLLSESDGGYRLYQKDDAVK